VGQAFWPNKSRAPGFDHHTKARRITGKDDIARPCKGWRDARKASAISRGRKRWQDLHTRFVASDSLNSGNGKAGAIPMPCIKGTCLRCRQLCRQPNCPIPSPHHCAGRRISASCKAGTYSKNLSP
jgi:hypothetical protein